MANDLQRARSGMTNAETRVSAISATTDHGWTQIGLNAAMRRAIVPTSANALIPFADWNESENSPGVGLPAIVICGLESVRGSFVPLRKTSWSPRLWTQTSAISDVRGPSNGT